MQLATVEATLTLPNGATQAMTAVTNAYGKARFTKTHKKVGSWQLCVDDITAPGYSYDPVGNTITCKTW